MSLLLTPLQEKVEPVLALYSLASKLEAMNSATRESTLLSLYDFASGNTSDTSSLTGAGLDDDEAGAAKTLFEKVAGDKDGFLRRMNILLLTLEQFGQSKGFTPTWEKSGTTGATAGGINLIIGGSVEAGVSVLYKQNKFTYSAIGEIGINGNAGLPFSYGALSINAGARRKAEVSLGAPFDDPANTRVFQALEKTLPDIDDALSPNKFLAGDFTTMALVVEGEVNLGGAVSLSNSWLNKIDVSKDDILDAIVAPPLSIKTNASLAFKYNWSKKGNFNLTLTQSGNKILVELSDLDTENKARSIEIGANIKFTNIKEFTRPFFEKIWSYPEKLVDFYDKYSSPGTLLKEKIVAIDPENEQLKELKNIIFGDGDTATFTNQLAGKFEEVAEENLLKLTDFTTDNKSMIIQWVMNKLPIGSDEHDQVESELSELYDEAVGKIEEELTGEIDTLKQDITGNKFAEKLQSTLDDAKESADDAVDVINQTAKQLLTPVEKAIAKYQKVKEAVNKAVEGINKEKLGISYSNSVKNSDYRTAELTIELDPSVVDMTAEYRRLLAGDFVPILELAKTNSAAVDIKSGLFHDTLTTEHKSVLTFNLFGFSTTSTNILNGELDLEYDVTGNISIFTTKASYEKVKEGFGETRSVKLASALSLAGIPSLDQIPLSIKFNYTDDNPTTEEIGSYLMSMENAGLIRKGACSELIAKAVANSAQADAEKVKIDTLFSMNTKDLLTATERKQVIIEQTALINQLEMLDKARNQLNAYRKLKRLSPNGNIFKVLAPFLPKSTGALRNSPDFKTLNPLVVGLAEKLKINCDALPEFLDNIADLLNSTPPTPGPNMRISNKDKKKIINKHTRAVSAMRNWLSPKGAIAGKLTPEAVSPYSLALILTLECLIQNKKHPDITLLPTVTWTRDGKERKVMVV